LHGVHLPLLRGLHLAHGRDDLLLRDDYGFAGGA
jgi:hypothetical protein